MSLTSQIKLRLFAVGCPRSGTTLLQGLLNIHPEITSFTESHFFDWGIKNPRLGPLFYVSKRGNVLVSEFLEKNRITYDVSSKLLKKKPKSFFIPGFGVSTWVQYFIEVLDKSAASRNKTIWLEKTPENLRRIDLIEKNTEKSTFIHIIREGGDTVASIVNAWSHYYSIEKAIKRWNDNLRYSIKRMHTGKDIFIHYDDLTEKTTTSLKYIFQKLGLTFDDRWLSNYTSSVKSIITPEESWKENVVEKIKKRSSFDATFNKVEKKEIMSKLILDQYQEIFKQIKL